MASTSNSATDVWAVKTITYNVNRQKPTRQSVQSWLNSEAIDGSVIVCVAMQEIPHSEVFKATRTHDTWSEQITFWMREHNLSLANKLCLASNMLLLYISMDILNLVERIDNRWCRDSLWGSVGYKGTISTKVEFRPDIVFVFITSHFFADVRYAQARIKQYHRSLYCTFPETVKQTQKRAVVFWQGDFNSRVEGFESAAKLIDWLDRNQEEDQEGLFRLVQTHDQLSKSMRAGLAFAGFNEARITFRPTYRILVGSGSYDSLRTPSWCDRVLYRGDTDHLSISNYSSCRSITLSDHFPASAQFSFRFPSTTQDQQTREWPRVEHMPTWEEQIPVVCRIAIPPDFWATECSSLDWLAIYPSTLDMVSRPLEWMYVFMCPFDDQRRLIGEFLPLASGTYRIGYFCARKNCLKALSNPFFVRKARKDD